MTHDRIQKAEIQLDSDVDPNRIAVDEAASRVDGQRHCPFAAVVPTRTLSRRNQLFHARTSQLSLLLIR